MKAEQPGKYIECAACHQRIRSKHRHDMVWCKCRETFVDGGSSYTRCGGRPVIEDGTIKTWPSKGRLHEE